jgi:hypothetical protein
MSIVPPLRESTPAPRQALEDAPRRPASPSAGSVESPSPFARLVQRLGEEVTQGEGLVQGALRARNGTIGPAELIALQAGVYRYSEAVDLAAKLVDHATTGIKTVLQGQ